MEIRRQTLLLLLLEDGERHGYALTEELRKVSGNHLDRSTVYRALQGLEEEGLVSSTWRPSGVGPNQRTYRLTRRGRRRARAARRELQATLDRLGSLLGR